jgi:hypothetical protein
MNTDKREKIWQVSVVEDEHSGHAVHHPGLLMSSVIMLFTYPNSLTTSSFLF